MMGTKLFGGERDDALSMPGVKHKGQDKPTLLEVGLRVQGNFRSRLAPLRVTPLQAGVMLYLYRQRGAKMKDAAALGVQPPTVTRVIHDLVRKRWVTNRRSIHDDRTLCLRLSRQGEVIARRIKNQVDRSETEMGRGKLMSVGQRVAKGTRH